VNVTEVPSQTGLADGEIATATGRTGSTVIVTALEFAGFPEAHCSLEVNWQVTISLLAGVNEYVGLFVPTGNPFTFQR
jgi:hypothetical protein